MRCYVLIGGRSTRMGQSKVPLFLPRVLAAAQPVFDQIIAVQRAGGDAVAIDTIFEEPHDERAPVFGVCRALQHAAADCFILAVDYPLVTSDLLRYIVARSEEASAPLVAPWWSGKLQMLCAAYGASMLPLLEERIAAHRYDLRGLADSALQIPEGELRERFTGEPLMNVNTPAEWKDALKTMNDER